MNKEQQNPLVAMICQAFEGVSLVRADQSFIRSALIHADASTATTRNEKKEATRECVEMNSVGARYSTEHDFAVSNGCAVIPVRGGLLNRFGYAFSYITGYNYIRSSLMAAANDSAITQIVLDIDSFGGQVWGLFETTDIIKEVAAVKPVVAYIDASCYSAAYAIAAACTKIYATPSAGVGSIGVVCAHMSVEKMLDNWGIEVTYIKAGDKKVDGSVYKKLTDEAKADMQASVDAMYEKFTTHVAESRKIDVKTVIDTQAGCFNTEDALSMGLIDGIVSPSMLITTLTQKDEQMSIETNKSTTAAEAPVADTTGASAATAERARISAITQSAEASKNPTLASHIAFNTDMSAEDAIKMLAASAPVAAPTASAHVAAPTASAPVATPLASAMSVTEQPNLLADAPAEASADAAPALMSNDAILSIIGGAK